jgi:hypothetical protein
VDSNAILAAAWMHAYVSHFPDAIDQGKHGLLPHDQSPAEAAAQFADSAIAALNERIQTDGGIVGYIQEVHRSATDLPALKPGAVTKWNEPVSLQR